MFKRRWIWFGKLRSDEGFDLGYGNKSVTYSDERGAFSFPFEDGYLFPEPRQVRGPAFNLSNAELEQMTNRVLDGIRSEGHPVEVWRK